MKFKILFLVLALMNATSFALSTKQVYIVHMDKLKMDALDQALPNSKRWFHSVLDSINELSTQEEDEEQVSEFLYVYETTATGFAAKLSEKQLENLENTDGFLLAFPNKFLHLHTTHSPQFLGLKARQGLWQYPNLTSDVIVGVLDTGIWPEHISFHDNGFPSVPSRWKGICEEGTKFSRSNCNKKIIGARAFFKGYEAAIGRINETTNYRSARDAEGHGTHTASTAAGNMVSGANFLGLAKGVASGVSFTSRIAVYKICYTLGCTDADILAAIDQAVKDGVDVLSLSLGGSAASYYTEGTSIGAFGAIRKGIFVSASAGNSGPVASSAGNLAPWLMTVAASTTDRSFPATIKLGNGKVLKGSSLNYGKPIQNLPLAYGNSAGGIGAAKCLNGSLLRKLVQGKIVVCDGGKIASAEKGVEVRKAGGVAMLVLNLNGTGEAVLDESEVLPAAHVGESTAAAIRTYVTTLKNPTATIAFDGTKFGNRAPEIAVFSSRGPSKLDPNVVKPDITAPGVDILAAWPPIVSPSALKSGDNRRVLFNIISGTSMSCPHVSGIAALLKARHRHWSAAAIKSAMMTTASNTDNKGSFLTEAWWDGSKLSSPFAYGSGHVDPERASDPGLIYDIAPEDYLLHLCSIGYTPTQIAILSRSKFKCPKNITVQPGDLNYPSFAVNFNRKANKVIFTFKRTVTNVGKTISTYKAVVFAPSGVSVVVEPKILNFSKLGEKLSYKITFTAAQKVIFLQSFGQLIWVSGSYSVNSLIAATWK